MSGGKEVGLPPLSSLTAVLYRDNFFLIVIVNSSSRLGSHKYIKVGSIVEMEGRYLRTILVCFEFPPSLSLLSLADHFFLNCRHFSQSLPHLCLWRQPLQCQEIFWHCLLTMANKEKGESTQCTFEGNQYFDFRLFVECVNIAKSHFFEFLQKYA